MRGERFFVGSEEGGLTRVDGRAAAVFSVKAAHQGVVAALVAPADTGFEGFQRGELLDQLEAPESVSAVCVAGEVAYAGCRDGRNRSFNMLTGDVVSNMKYALSDRCRAMCAADGYVFVAADDGAVHVFSRQFARCVLRVTGINHRVLAVWAEEEEWRLHVATADGAARSWRLKEDLDLRKLDGEDEPEPVSPLAVFRKGANTVRAVLRFLPSKKEEPKPPRPPVRARYMDYEKKPQKNPAE